MSSRRNSLSPPERQGTIDPGAHELGTTSPSILPSHQTNTPPAEASDSEEHYSDAQSGPVSPTPASPIPKTRVEKVDDKPAYGEVPGTQAYRLREGDAEPDEIAIIPDPSEPSKPEPEQTPRSPTPGGHPIPTTVVEETPDAEGSVTRPENRQRRKSDAHPDLVVKADGKVEDGGAANDTPISSSLNPPATPARTRRKSSLALKRSPLSPGLPGAESAVADGDDDFGDDFDDFEEGGEDGDFDDFDDGFQTPAQQQQPQPQPPPPTSAPTAPSLSFPIPTFTDLTPSEITSLAEPYLTALFPPPASPPQPLPTPSAKENPIFLTPRSASLWSQLVAPPPLQPPDWIRSRIRRLFLVSLGVPVDLDEILPASSKQKKLVLPSLHRTTSSGSLRTSSDSRATKGGASSSAAAGVEGGRKDSGLSSQADPSGPGSSSRKQKKAEASGGGGRQQSPERSFDLVSARQVCMLTDAALSGMTDAELRAHVARLEAMQGTAQGVLAYWQKRTDEKIGDREAFEGVIENLVKHARKVRK
ncbi:hypothetical protein C8A01DRAFT_47224 [Parachaetomium inaequale]|uniref:Uncharacterized protein n=1 Tax=Parachaetomium inaequale TaxID=2588326 RepID=A0AAN6PE19_9PEZI|nr:hypothetical protein C8A01DRAFT_47224 [Parachaetomium inaequale]